MSRLQPASDAGSAQWVVERTRGFAENVGSLVPHGFAAYARIFHPASIGDEHEQAVTWTEIAASNARVMHPEAQWPNIAFVDDVTDINQLQNPPEGAVWRSAPEEGSLDIEVARALAEVLRNHTSSPDRCWFGAWEGWGGLRPELRNAPAFELPSRRYFLLQGIIDALTDTVEAHPGWYQSASLWWPDDEAWCVATEVDLESTYIGASRACVDQLLSHADLEAFEVNVTDGVTWASDKVNPSPLKLWPKR